ncbi:hypothetical protein PGB90_008306 [Kerria lacca]
MRDKKKRIDMVKKGMEYFRSIHSPSYNFHISKISHEEKTSLQIGGTESASGRYRNSVSMQYFVFIFNQVLVSYVNESRGAVRNFINHAQNEIKKNKGDGKSEIYSVNFCRMDLPKSKTFSIKNKKSTTENCCFSMARRRCRSVSPSPSLTDISKIMQTVKLQTLRPENSAKCKKLLRCNGYPIKVLLYPEESWARTATSSYWKLSPIWWNYSRCKVIEVTGTKRTFSLQRYISTKMNNRMLRIH